jgi:hypothetical protein
MTTKVTKLRRTIIEWAGSERSVVSLSHWKNFAGGDSLGRAAPGDVEPSPNRRGSTRSIPTPFLALIRRSR